MHICSFLKDMSINTYVFLIPHYSLAYNLIEKWLLDWPSACNFQCNCIPPKSDMKGLCCSHSRILQEYMSLGSYLYP